MGGQFLSTVLVVILACLLLVAALTDLRSRIIANGLNAAIALMAPLFWFATGLDPWPDMAIQLGLGFLILAIFTAAFSLGVMGGGDVKLLAALALWLPWQAMLVLLVLMSVLGGAVTLATMIHHRATKKEGPPEVPYGVAISLAALWVIGEPYINHFTG